MRYNEHVFAYDNYLVETANQVNALFASEYEFLGSGWSRLTYDLGNGIVAKIPYEPSDAEEYIRTFLRCNLEEYDFAINGHPLGFPCPKSFGLQDWFGIPVIYLEKVQTIYERRKEIKEWDHNVWPWDDPKPNWLSTLPYEFSRQVGLTSDGRFVIYDFTYNIDPMTGETADCLCQEDYSSP